jgi:hypothetical protein
MKTVDWKTITVGVVAAGSALLIGAMAWMNRKNGYFGSLDYNQIEDIAPQKITEKEEIKYDPKVVKPVKKRSGTCKPWTPVQEMTTNTKILRCLGEPLGRVSTSRDVYEFARGQGNLLQEELVVLSLDSKNQVVASSIPHRGTATEVVLKLTDVFRIPVILGTPRAVLVHNHPSGDPTPSQHDLDFTKSAIAMGNSLGIAVLDHVIVGKDDYLSLRDFMGEQFR